MGNSSEFQKAVKLVIDTVSFDKDSTVQVFEATIRYVVLTSCPQSSNKVKDLVSVIQNEIIELEVFDRLYSLNCPSSKLFLNLL